MNTIENIRDTDLGRFSANAVKMSAEETKRVMSVIDPILRDIGQTLSDGDVFVKQPHYGGSYYKNTKVRQADEFDIQFEIKPFLKEVLPRERDATPRDYAFFIGGNRVSEKQMKSVTPENADVELRRTNSQPIRVPGGLHTFVKAPKTGNGEVHPQLKDITFDGDVVSYLAQKKFKTRIDQWISSGRWRGSGISRIALDPEWYGPSLNLNLQLGVTSVKVDLMVALPVRIIPSFHQWDWPRRETTAWLGNGKIETIKSKRLNVVPRKPYYWEMVDADLYSEVFNGIDQNGGCRKENLRILKTMRDKYWNGSRDWAVIKSFMLENLLLWECEKYPSAHDWAQSRRAERFQGLMRSLITHFRERRLPHYFNPNVNLLEIRKQCEIDDQRKILEEFMRKPVNILET